MRIENNIGWCDETTNAVTGCTEVSLGCARCYAKVGTRARVLRSQGRETWGAKGERVPVNFEPVFRRLNKLCVCDKCHQPEMFHNGNRPRVGTMHQYKEVQMSNADGDIEASLQPCDGILRRIRLFADSNSDWLDPKWPVETLARFLDAIRLAPNVDVLLLTKRIELLKERLNNVSSMADSIPTKRFLDWMEDAAWFASKWHGDPPSNVWLGVSVEDQKRADDRIPLLLKTPAAVRFLSVEPLLEKVEVFGLQKDFQWKVPLTQRLTRHPDGRMGDVSRPDWVIVGGESGKNRRDCGVEAIESVVQQCARAGVPVYCKQDCAFASGQKGRLSDSAWSFKEFPR